MKQGPHRQLKRYQTAARLLFVFMMVLPGWCLGQDNASNRTSFMLGEPGLILSLPCGATPMESSVPLDKINAIQRFDTYRLYYAEGKVVALFKFIQFNSPIAETLSELLNTESNGVLTMIKATTPQEETSVIQLQEWSGMQRTGSFMLQEKPWNFKDVMFVRNNAMWQLWIAAEQSDPEYEIEINRILSSMQFSK